MAFRGRGRGRGGGFANHYAKQEPVLLYPDSVNLPPTEISQDEDMAFLTRSNIFLQNFFETSPYNLKQEEKTHIENPDIERFSDKFKSKNPSKSSSLSHYLKLNPKNFPQELIQGARKRQCDQKKVNWNQDSRLGKLDILEKLEEKYGEGVEKGEAEKKEGEDEEEEVEDVAEEEVSENDDYDHMLDDFQDDEDDFNNVDDENEDEPTYEP